MCLKPITMPTNSKYINLATIGTRLQTTFNCGKCAECLQFKHYEYYLRSSAEFKATEKAGGFSYWETLTYAPEHVPVIVPQADNYTVDGIEVQCTKYVIVRGEENHKTDGTTLKVFNRADYRYFFRILRQKIRRAGYDVKNNLRYFFVSEYGNPEKTFRPHYHVIFFVTIPNMTPELFQKLVRESWKHGRTDLETPLYPVFDIKKGKYKGHVINGLGVTQYVAKYVNKPFIYNKLLENFQKKNHLSKDEYNNIKPFHCQSQGFGFALVNETPLEEIIKHGRCEFEDSKGKRFVTLPMYHIRKLFYDCVTFSDGSRHWQLNDNGKKWQNAQEHTILMKSAERLQDIYNNLPVLQAELKVNYDKYTKDNNALNLRKEENLQLKVLQMLGNKRDFLDLAIYQRYYKGRVNCFLIPTVTTVIKAGQKPLIDYTALGSDDLNDAELVVFNKPFTLYEYKEQSNTYENVVKYDSFNHQFFNNKEQRNHFATNHSYNQDSHFAFRHFDDIIQLFSLYNDFVNTKGNRQYQDKCDAEERVRYVKQKFNL